MQYSENISQIKHGREYQEISKQPTRNKKNCNQVEIKSKGRYVTMTENGFENPSSDHFQNNVKDSREVE